MKSNKQPLTPEEISEMIKAYKQGVFNKRKNVLAWTSYREPCPDCEEAKRGKKP